MFSSEELTALRGSTMVVEALNTMRDEAFDCIMASEPGSEERCDVVEQARAVESLRRRILGLAKPRWESGRASCGFQARG